MTLKGQNGSADRVLVHNPDGTRSRKTSVKGRMILKYT